MKDKAGAEITVGCRVTECDMGYGVGVVESIAVRTTGVGFNVGIKWDIAGDDKPGWSTEGGGRSAEHLLVIEAAPETVTEAAPAVGLGHALGHMASVSCVELEPSKDRSRPSLEGGS